MERRGYGAKAEDLNDDDDASSYVGDETQS